MEGNIQKIQTFYNSMPTITWCTSLNAEHIFYSCEAKNPSIFHQEN